MRLRYGSLEGPENGVYFRGRTTENVIHLPDHWKGLIDPESITVHLTSIGDSWATPAVDYVDGYTVKVNNYSKGSYFFIVYAERIDIPKLTIEYVEDGYNI